MTQDSDFNDKDFLDELYNQVQKIDPVDWSSRAKIALSFPREYAELMKRREVIAKRSTREFEELFDKDGRMYKEEWRYPARMRAYMAYAEKFDHMGILNDDGLLLDDFTFTVSLVPQDFIAVYRERYGITNKIKLEHDKTADNFLFTLDKHGSLSHKYPLPSEKPYRMDEGGNPYRVLKELVKASKGSHQSFYGTQQLADVIGITVNQIHDAVEKIRKGAKRQFEYISADEFIEGKQSSGYRLGTNVRIAFIP